MKISSDDYPDDEQESKSKSVEQFREKLIEYYEKLHAVVLDNLPDQWPQLEFALSIKSILNIKGCTLPFAGIILGPPSSSKTAAIELLRGYRHTFYTDNFTSKSIISHNAAIKKEKLEEVDMLPKMENKLFLTPELAPIFGAKEENLIEILGLLTRLLDGHGYTSDTGSQGHRTYDRDIMFTWIGAVVEITYKVHKHLSRLGPKLYFFRLPRIEHTESELLYYCEHVSDSYSERFQKIRVALHEYLAYFEMDPRNEEPEGELPKIPFGNGNSNGNGNNKEDLTLNRYLITIANLLSRLRAIVPTFRDNDSPEYGHGIAIIEDSKRAITQLRNLMKGHALSQGRNSINVDDDFKIVIDTVLSTCSLERSTIFDLLLAYNGELTTTQVRNSLSVSKHTALRTMTELDAIGLVDMYPGDNNTESAITLKHAFRWFLSDRFKELRSRAKKYPPRTQPIPINNLLYDYTV